MNHLLSNKFFIVSILLIGLQQLAIGLSTYCIGLAGLAAAHNPTTALKQIMLFFTLVALAYPLGALSLLFQTRLSNECWAQYCQKIFQQLGSDIGWAMADNKTTTQNWMAGESFQTFQEASHTFVDAVAVFLNVLFTIIAFALVLGGPVALAVLLSLLLAVLSMWIAKSPIQRLARQIQWQKVTALNALHRIWDNLFFGDQHNAQAAQHRANQPVQQLFALIQRHKLIEQLFSCAPILIAIPIIILVAQQQVSHHPALLGALVAILPRSLQLLQNTHAFCSSVSNIIFLSNKLNNLERFVLHLPKQPLTHGLHSQAITINCLQGPSNQHWTPATLLEHLTTPHPCQGRFLITGGNGSGKSSLLKLIKQKNPAAILWGPGVVLGTETVNGSVGEQHLHILQAILDNRQESLLLLDEWDSALDHANTEAINQQLDLLANSNIILEVRHKIANPTPR